MDVVSSVTNRTSRVLNRVYGLSKSDNGFFDSLEFPFGQLKPGETKSWSVSRKLPLALSERADLVELEIHSDALVNEQVSSTIAEIQADAPPVLVYRYRLDDRKGGNGDGLLQTGELVDFLIDVENVSQTVAKDAFVTVRNTGGKEVFLKVGRASLGEIAPGKSKQASLSFEVKGHGADAVAKFQLSVWDGEFASGFSDELEFDFAKQQKVQKARGAAQATVDLDVYGAASLKAVQLGTLQTGTRVRATAKIGEFTRVTLGKDSYGFVLSQFLKSAKKPSKTVKYEERPGQEPPRIGMSLPQLVTESDTLDLEIRVSDRDSLQDMYIFVNDQKVFFSKFTDTVRGKDGVSVVLRPKIPLEEGTNEIGLVVRESETLMGRRSFAVYRKSLKLGTAKTPELRGQ